MGFKCVLMILLLSCGCTLSKEEHDGSDDRHPYCHDLDDIVLRVVADAARQDPRMSASVLRLHFHDCFVHGCDGSVLLDGADGEKFAFPNKNSLRGFEVIDQIKTAVLQECNNTVSCADILALAARAAVKISGGPQWRVNLGRNDSTAAYQALANTALPSPQESLDSIVAKFAAVGLTKIQDVVALSGGHTFGRAHCFTFANRLYNYNGTGKADPSMNKTYVAQLQAICPESSPNGLANLDPATNNTFDNKYFSNLKMGYGLLTSDQELYSSGNSSSSSISQIATRLVTSYAAFPFKFFEDFANSMFQMSNIAPPSNSTGEIRLNCRVINGAS